MRTAITLVPLLLLAACSKGAGGSSAATVAEQNEVAAPEDNHVPCALGGAKEFKPDCTREIAQVDGKEMWTIRSPGGGFRRFQIIDDKDSGGTRIATADGAWEVQAVRVGNELEVRVGDDSYRFPAAPEAPVANASKH
jgi:hypothetical protein